MGIYFQSFGAWLWEIEVWAGLVPSEASLLHLHLTILSPCVRKWSFLCESLYRNLLFF